MDIDKKYNEVIRVQKRKNSFVMMDKTFLEDTRLSYKAKGILAYLLGKPDNWKVIVGNLVNYSTDGKASVYTGLKELKECGYYTKTPIRNEKGTCIIRWESVIYEIPSESIDNADLSLLTDFQEIENEDIENLFIENRVRNNNYINNNYINNNYFTNNYVKSSQSEKDRPNEQTDMTKKIEACTKYIKENIRYDELIIARKSDIKLIDEFIAIILDVVMTLGETIHIGGANKSRELVKHNLLLLDYDDIEYAIDQFKGVKERISKKKQYILAILYNCKMERDSHYTNLVKSDRYFNQQGVVK